MIERLREAKLSSNKKIKVRFFTGRKTEDLIFHLIPDLKFILGRMMRHIKTRTSFIKNSKKTPKNKKTNTGS